MLTFTLLTSEQPLGKSISVGADGAVRKAPLAHLTRGIAEVRELANLGAFAHLRQSLTEKQALVYGVSAHPRAVVVAKGGRPPPSGSSLPIIHRDAASFRWGSGPGLLLLDHDPPPGEAGWACETLVQAVIDAMPGLKGRPMLWAPSASSCIFDSRTGAEVIGLRGARLWVLVDDARAVPDLGALLFKRLALEGHGRIAISQAGTLLRRGPIDASVWQPERLDFVRATVGRGLVQRPMQARLFWGDAPPAPAAQLLVDHRLTDAETGRADEGWRALESQAAAEATVVRRAWATGLARRRLGAAGDVAAVDELAERLSDGAQRQHLDSDHLLQLQNGRHLTASEALDELDAVCNLRLHDPLEPEYGDRDARIGLFTLGRHGQVGIFSHAHGGQHFVLRGPWTAEEDFGALDDDALATTAGGVSSSSYTGTAVATPAKASAIDDAAPRKLTAAAKQFRADVPGVLAALRRPEVCGVRVAHDAFTQRVMVAPAGEGPPRWRDLADVDYVRLREHLQRVVGFGPVGRDLARDCVALVAAENVFDSAQEWLARLPPWDGVQRVARSLPAYFGAEDSPYTRAVGRYIWTALAGRVLSPGCKADMVPVAVGDQGARKSTTVAAMVPAPEFFGELNLAQRDDDTSRLLQGRLVVELAELRGLKTRDAESIKAFLSSTHDRWVEKWQTCPTVAPRRGLFFGTSNEASLLSDPTGNRRWLPFFAGRCDPVAMTRDRDQLWAEGVMLFKAGGVDHSEAERLAAGVHSEFTESDSIEDPIGRWLADDAGSTIEGRVVPRFVTVADVLRGALGVAARVPTKAEEGRVAAVLKGLGWQRVTRELGGRRVRGWALAAG